MRPRGPRDQASQSASQTASSMTSPMQTSSERDWQDVDTEETSCITGDTADTWSVMSDTSTAVTSATRGPARRHVLRAHTYLHVQDQDSGITRLVSGPCSVSVKPSERVVAGPEPMVVVPAAHYCVVVNPAVRTGNHVAFDEFGQALLRHGEREVRGSRAPFPLYPGERLLSAVRPLPVVGERQALQLRALQDTTDGEGNRRGAGDRWYVTRRGAYTPGMAEEVLELVDLQTITLSNREYCIVCTPVLDAAPQRRTVRGPRSFLLMPGDFLDGGVRAIRFLQAPDALDLVAREAFTDESGVQRAVGDRWTVRGPAVLAPSAEVEVVRQHSVMRLSGTEGVYVQDVVTGAVRAVQGEPYLLTADEQLWSKPLAPDAESLLPDGAHRDKTRLVQYFVRQNRVVVIEDQQTGDVREVHGPRLATLQPDEQFRVFSLPDGSPVQPGCRQSLTLPLLGEQNYLTDIVTTGGEDGQGAPLRKIMVKIAWKLAYPTSGPVATDGVDEAYKLLKHRLHADAAHGPVRKLYELGDFRFDVTVNSDVTNPPGEGEFLTNPPGEGEMLTSCSSSGAQTDNTQVSH